ncbi:helicase-exonuclease AddAB subunit AddA [Paenibacillus abyssi]|uniref:ATP-dependent helicase/nuclease subunit A n=1 Tax=Paenibacillus abyssi TaxID=1340531 RepID=A0A917D4S8_9BACL|nr:helicase-exonuclease AddAB subunit AddA [Paenibacillus abyssi]GGG10764.1 ATP-dependent helicase/nuclease subunit A [Paenibacillus abyssi]
MVTEHNDPKPAGSTWTDEQWHAVVAGGRDILVAAAAGSGKTAVLVERIIRKITNDTDVDRLLVATFTKAAASEMKERIRIALEKELERNSASDHLRRQLALMNRASITTLHSFCLDVIRRYYPLIGLDPGFRIANETEAELMRIDVLDELFEQRYADIDNSSGFVKLVDDFGGERGDEPLYRLVQQLYDFSRSQPWPEFWLRETAAAFRVSTVEELSRTQWVQSLVIDVKLALDGAKALLEQAIDVTRFPGGPDAYADTLLDDLSMVSGLRQAIEALPWLSWYEAFQGAGFGKLKAVRGDSIDKALQEKAKTLRDQAKTLVTDLIGELFQRPPEVFLSELQEVAPQMEALAELVIDFGALYEAAKRQRGLLDFGDLEHYCLRILRDPASSPERTVPSAAALEYQKQFDEILLDEYQDTNSVQEAIVSLLALPGTGNRFMVGDVKQSIYGFRLAEPKLFLHKYKTFTGEAESGLRIDLARNFRSRKEVVDGVNDVFRGIMRESVAEMDYDRSAELVNGAAFPSDELGGVSRYAVELTLLDRAGTSAELDDASSYDAENESEEGQEAAVVDAADLQTAQIEARWIAAQIRNLLDGGNGTEPFRVYDGKGGISRPVAWRDIVILLRATQQWAPILIEELQAFGIPAYAELNSGYFDATEVEIMLSLLRVIDNPYQDIPLAGTLRSPIFGLNAEELALVRVYAGKGPYYDAVLQASEDLLLSEQTRRKLGLFLERLGRWREEARQGSLSDLLWSIYRETGYYDLVGGLPGGVQRQANLRALHDRARQYEATSFRGLFRFLRFIDRMRESGGDLGTARALGEQEDVVRIMSIHKSKGLEFPIVFVAGLGKTFNMQDLNGSFLKHKQLGFGPRFIDSELRVGYPTLPYLSIRRKMRMEMLAEEMRILYVALTRPKEKLFLVGTASDAQKQLERWQAAAASGYIPDHSLASARRFMDWLLPLGLQQTVRMEQPPDAHPGDAGWKFGVAPASLYAAEAAAAIQEDAETEAERSARLDAVLSLALIDNAASTDEAEQIDSRLSWRYPFAEASMIAAKTSVTELKRLHSEPEYDDGQRLEEIGVSTLNSNNRSSAGISSFRLRRPRFMEEISLTAAERGTVSHLLMQHVPLNIQVDRETLEQTVQRMLDCSLLTAEQAEAIDLNAVEGFFTSELGTRLQRAGWIRREVPFSSALPAGHVHRSVMDDRILSEETVLIQGVIDCLFEDEQGLVLLDYKTDRILNGRWEETAERHRFQLELYVEAIGGILGRNVDESYVFFFDGGHSVRMT